jgi:hypothetical protein
VTVPNRSDSTAVATQRPRLPVSPEQQRVIDENRARNAIIQQLRGTVWSKEMNADQIRTLAQYCRENSLDAVRHVEVLGGRIYLTAEFYDERGAWLIREGVIQPEEPDYINADARLDDLAAKGDAWAKGEAERRLRARIQFAVPEAAKAAVVQRFRITQTGAVVTGVNWCGHGGKRDPVGDAEPAKTAQTRARRRAWKQIADVIPAYGAVVRPVEERAAAVAPVMTVEAGSAARALGAGRRLDVDHGAATDAYIGAGPGPQVPEGRAIERPHEYEFEETEDQRQLRLDDERIAREEQGEP